MTEMNQHQLTALCVAIADVFEHQADSGCIESYVKHYFWNWYISAQKKKEPPTLQAFFEKIPVECRRTKAEVYASFCMKHAELLKVIGNPNREDCEETFDDLND